MCAGDQVEGQDTHPGTIAKVLEEELKIWRTRVTSDKDKDLGSIDDNVLAVCTSLAGRDKVITNNLLLRLSAEYLINVPATVGAPSADEFAQPLGRAIAA